jgi:NYN domain
VFRVCVFIDYENCIGLGTISSRRSVNPYTKTVLDPLQIAQRLVARRKMPSVLAGVYAYRGRPLPQFQPRPTSANDLLARAWAGDGVRVVRRDLKYSFDDEGNWSAQEKGIDVALAVGVVEAAMSDVCDVAIVFSNDTDQLPALEQIFTRRKPRWRSRVGRRPSRCGFPRCSGSDHHVACLSVTS